MYDEMENTYLFRSCQSLFHTQLCMMEMMSESRPYRMKKRREDVEETRRRVVEATVELHGTVGPAHTTVSAVADLAGVQRSTVYRHFPDEETLFGACTSHWLARHPWPRSEVWATEPDPVVRLRIGLGQVYAYFEANRDMLGNSLRDVEVMPAFVGELMRAQVVAVHEALTEGWEAGDPAVISAAVGAAIDFRTWSALSDQGLAADQAADTMTAMIAALD
jgi:AcrR family transcriptional regulator